jgi:predicted transcriptional regulator
MKIIINKKSRDPIAEARKNKKFDEFSRDSKMRINLGIEVYNRRKELGLSQQKLAKIINSTQKVISNIENGSVDFQSSTINRINGVLKFSAQQWAEIFDFTLPGCKIFIQNSAINSNKPLTEFKQIQEMSVSQSARFIN